MSDLPTYELERVFAAPRELVWRAWTDPVLLARWYGPNVETIVHRFEPRAGGLWLGEMRREGRSSYQRAEFTEVTPPGRLVWLQSSSDADWNVISLPKMPDWPRVMLTTVTFEEDGEGTRMRLLWQPYEASEAELACFASVMDGVGRGWGAGMELLAELLAELQA